MASLGAYAKEQGIKYFLISFIDLFGTMRAKLVPAAAIDAISKSGAGFAGFATWLDMTPADPDMFAMPDPDSVIQLPWKPEVAWLAGDLIMDGKPVDAGPAQGAQARDRQGRRAQGYELKTGVECEYFLIQPDGKAISDAADSQAKPCYDQQALMRRYDVIAEICDNMLALGWSPYQNDHEDANGQFEMNWEYDSALMTADRHAFFKYMVKSIAEKHGLRATFMPKPFSHLTGNGCHAHVSLWSSTTGKNLFEDAEGELGLSALGYNFIAGVMHAAEALAAITNPTVNSYKRINAPPTLSGATWSPNTITYAGNNRTHMIRIPDAGPLRAAPGRRRRQSLSAAGRNPGRGARRHQEQARSRQAPRHRHVRRGPYGEGRPAAAAQPPRCAARLRAVGGATRGPRRRILQRLSQAQIRRLEQILPPSDRMGARDDTRLLGPQKPRDRLAGRNRR